MELVKILRLRPVVLRIVHQEELVRIPVTVMALAKVLNRIVLVLRIAGDQRAEPAQRIITTVIHRQTALLMDTLGATAIAGKIRIILVQVQAPGPAVTVVVAAAKLPRAVPRTAVAVLARTVCLLCVMIAKAVKAPDVRVHIPMIRPVPISTRAPAEAPRAMLLRQIPGASPTRFCGSISLLS